MFSLIHFNSIFPYKPSIWGFPHGYGNPHMGFFERNGFPKDRESFCAQNARCLLHPPFSDPSGFYIHEIFSNNSFPKLYPTVYPIFNSFQWTIPVNFASNFDELGRWFGWQPHRTAVMFYHVLSPSARCCIPYQPLVRETSSEHRSYSPQGQNSQPVQAGHSQSLDEGQLNSCRTSGRVGFTLW